MFDFCHLLRLMGIIGWGPRPGIWTVLFSLFFSSFSFFFFSILHFLFFPLSRGPLYLRVFLFLFCFVFEFPLKNYKFVTQRPHFLKFLIKNDKFVSKQDFFYEFQFKFITKYIYKKKPPSLLMCKIPLLTQRPLFFCNFASLNAFYIENQVIKPPSVLYDSVPLPRSVGRRWRNPNLLYQVPLPATPPHQSMGFIIRGHPTFQYIFSCPPYSL